MRYSRRLQFAAACVLIVAYAGFSHYCISAGGEHDLGAVLALAPLVLVLTILIWRSLHPAIAWAPTAVIGGALVYVWPLLKSRYSLVYLIQDSSVYGLIGLTFGRSLLPGRIALCTQLADKVHGPLSPRECWYTRRVTAAWTLFFAAAIAMSLLLFALAPLPLWSAFVNFCVLPLIFAMFMVESLVVRRWVLPQVTGAGLLATVRVYLATSH